MKAYVENEGIIERILKLEQIDMANYMNCLFYSFVSKPQTLFPKELAVHFKG
jgi:hypothetical protein